MKRKFTVIIERKGKEWIARCQEMPGVEGRGHDKKLALERIRVAIIKKLGDGPESGSASLPHPGSPPPPPGPIIVESIEEPNN